MPTYYSQEYPLGTPSVAGNNLTVDLMLREPTRITNYLSNVALKNYFAERIFTNGGGVSGGALVYSQLVANDILPTRAAQTIAPGAEFPEVTFDRPAPLTAQVEKLGGGFWVTDEARDRNDLSAIQSEGAKLGNDIQRQLHARALSELDASIAAIGSDGTMVGTSWADAAALTLTSTANSLLPHTDFANLRKKAAIKELGVEYNLLIVNPQERANFEIIYQGRANEVLAANGLSMVVSNIVAAGTAYAVQEGMVGQVRYEKALSTEVDRTVRREATWVQASVRHVFAVTNPYCALTITGLAA